MVAVAKGQIESKFLVMIRDTVSSPLREGDTTFIIFLAGSSTLDRFTFINENKPARGEFRIAVANEKLSADSDKWTSADGAVPFKHSRLFNVSILGVEAKYVRLTFHVEHEKNVGPLNAPEAVALALSLDRGSDQQPDRDRPDEAEQALELFLLEHEDLGDEDLDQHPTFEPSQCAQPRARQPERADHDEHPRSERRRDSGPFHEPDDPFVVERDLEGERHLGEREEQQERVDDDHERVRLREAQVSAVHLRANVM